MGEQPLFLEGQPPDFSLLQRLLCLESEPCDPPPLLLLPPGPGGAATTRGDPRRMGGPEPTSPLRTPPGEGLTFLQESVRLLSPPERPPAAPAALPETPGVPAVPTGSPDALSLISLQCRQLDTGSGNGTGINIGIGTGIDTGTGNGTGIHTGISTGSGAGRRRKQATPQRGADPRDPSFRGVTLRMSLGVPAGGTGGCRLLISARRAHPRSPGSSSSEDEAPPAQGHKRCASCKTRRTPLWRAAENGTPLCNACGIRYKKYRVRCRRCWNVPCKSGTPKPPCPLCAHWGPPAPHGDRR